MPISYSDNVKLPLTEARLEACLEQFLHTLNYEDRYVSLYFTDDEEIRDLNHRYRGKDRPTDILSWSYWEEDPHSECLGEMVVSLDRVHVQAQTHGWPDDVEVLRLLAHGCAHLVGYDHERSEADERKMLAVEIQMLKRVDLDYVYPQD